MTRTIKSFVCAAFALALSTSSALAFDTPYLTFRSPETFSIRVSSPKWDGTMEYSTDAASWTTWTGSEIYAAQSGDEYFLYLRGTGNSVVANGSWSFTGTGELVCEGDIRTLRDYTGNLPAMGEKCYYMLFCGCTQLTTPPMLPETTLAVECYNTMFGDCTSLKSIPALPATGTLPNTCYFSMFRGCSSLEVNTTGPGVEWSLPAGATGSSIWNWWMFQNTAGDCPETPVPGTTYYVKSALPPGLKQETSELHAYTGAPININLADTIDGGTGEYTFTDTSSALSALGLSLSGTTLSGTISTADNYNFTLHVADTTSPDPLTLDPEYTLVVVDPDPLSAQSNLGKAKVGQIKHFTLSNTISGGVSPYVFAFVGTPPSEFSLVGDDLSLTPSEAKTYTCVISVTDQLGTSISPDVTYTVEAVVSAGFVDDDPEEPASGVQADCRTLEGTYPRTCNLITTSASTVIWDNSWYYVTGDVTLSAGAIVSNKVSLILGDDATLTVVGAYDKAGIAVLPGNTLTIYGQSAGAHVGKLVVTGGNGSAGIGGDHWADCGKVTIYGGDVTATGTGWSAGIGGGDDNNTVGGTIAVYGGKVTANGGHSQPGIGGGYSSGNAGTLTVGDNIVVKAGSNENPTTVLPHGENGAITLQHTSRSYYVIETSGPAPLTQTTSTLAAYTGEAAEFDLSSTVSGGTRPYMFALKAGSDYPAGFTLSGTTLSCTSASVGGSFTMVVTDSGTGSDAQNEEFTYTITVGPRPKSITYMDGASEVKGLTPSNYVEGVGATLPANPPKTDYTFYGWYDNAGLTGTPVTEISTEARGPQTFWGRWLSNSGSIVNYKDAGGSPHSEFCTPITSSTTALADGWYYVSGSVVISSTVTISGNVNLILTDDSSLSISVDYGAAIGLTGDNSLTIYGQTKGNGSLSAINTDYGPGIGSESSSTPCGTLTINGGVVTAEVRGSYSYSAIGSCYQGNGGTVTINGGTVTATVAGTNAGAAIGGGQSGSGGTVTINGGTVTATANSGAGIGGGMSGAGGTVTINGGVVTASSSNQGAGIGGGMLGAGGTVTINGGTVTANGGVGAAGIGGGSSGASQGSLTVGANVTVKAGSSAEPTTVLEPDSNGVITLEGQRYFTAEAPAVVPGVSSITYIGRDGETPIAGLLPSTYNEGTGAMLAYPSIAGYTFHGWYDNAELTGDPISSISAEATGPLTFYGNFTPSNYQIFYYDGDKVLSLLPAYYTIEDDDVVLPDPTATYAPAGKAFGGWCLESDCSDTPTRTIPAGSTGNRTFYVKWIDEAEAGVKRVTFVRASGAAQTEICKILTTDVTELSNGWHVVVGDLVYPDGGITVAGDNVNLVLEDDSSLVVTGAMHKAGVNVASGNSLTIYGQSADTGALTVFGGMYGAGIGGNENETCGAVTINGGTISATYGSNAAGIGGGKNGSGGAVTINGGAVAAYGGLDRGIGGGRDATEHGTLTVGEYVTVSAGNSQYSSLSEQTPDEHGSIALQNLAFYKAVTKRPKNISYRKADGTTGNALCTALDADATMLSNDWYVVMSDLTIKQCLPVYGDVKLILCDDVTFTVTGKYSSVVGSSGPGIWVPTNATLTIYGQSADTGVLNAIGDSGAGIGGLSSGSNNDCGTVTINGGTITAVGGDWAAGIGGGNGGAGGTVTINGGDVTATAVSSYTAGIGGASGKADGTLTIGPQMVAKAGVSANPTEALDYDLETGRVTFKASKLKYFTVKVDPEAPAVHTITYKDGDDVLNGLTPTKYRVGTGAALPANVDRYGFVFFGWYDNAELSGSPVTAVTTTDNEDKTFYGRFLERTSSVTFVGADGNPQTETCTLLTANDTELGNGWYCVDGELDYGKGISVSGAAKIVLKDGATLIADGVRGGVLASSPGISVPEGSSLTIYAQSSGASAGALIATGYDSFAAGIGGANGVNCGSVTIYGGAITATGGTNAAGIGGGDGGNGGTVAIYGGTVVAVSPSSSAHGIGGGNGAEDQGTLTVGEYVAVYAGLSAELAVEKTPQAGVIERSKSEPYYRAVSDVPQMIAYCEADGTEKNASAKIVNADSRTLVSGWYAVTDVLGLPPGGLTVQGDVKLILEDGARLAVTGTLHSAGITVASGNTLTIYGQDAGTGELIATGAEFAAGIGVGSDAVVGTVVINGGTVTAQGGANGGAGIGGGPRSAGGTVIVSNGVVSATGGSVGGAGIGGGSDGAGATVRINGGSVEATGGSLAAGIGGGSNGAGGTVTIDGGDVAAQGGTNAAGIGGGNYGAGGTVTINGGTVAAQGDSYGVAGIGGGSMGSDDGTLTVGDDVVVMAGSSSSSALTEKPHGVNGAITRNGEAYYETKMVELTEIAYRKADGTEDSEFCRILTEESSILAAGWYAVTNELTLTKGLVASGDVKLILCKDATLTVTGEPNKPGIEVTSGDSLTIYAQPDGAGTLIATGGSWSAGIGGGSDAACGTVTIYGGTVTATGAANASGIGGGYKGAGGTVAIYGGTVTAQGGSDGAGIGGGYERNNGTVTVNGGTVTATGGDRGAGIGGGYHGNGGTVTVNGGTVVATGGGTAAAGIGGGSSGEGGTVVVNGGTVTATGVAYGPGIGGGGISSGRGTLQIASTMDVLAGDDAESLVKLLPDNGNMIALNGTSAVYQISPAVFTPVAYRDTDGIDKQAQCRAFATTLANGWYAITSDVVLEEPLVIVGNNVNLIIADDATLTVVEGERDKAGIRVATGCALTIYGQSNGTGAITATGGSYAAGIGGNHGEACGAVTINGGNVTVTGGLNAAGIGGGLNGNGGAVTINGGTVVAKGKWTEPGIGGGNNASSQGTLTVGEDILFMAGSSESTLAVKEPSAGAIALEGLNFCKAVMAENVRYTAADGTTQQMKATQLVAASSALSPGWYVAKENVAFAAGITISGDVSIILNDGVTVTVQADSNHAGINVPAGSSLSIYSASGAGTGALVATGGTHGAGIGGNNGESCGAVAIYGGSVKATGGVNGAGVGKGYNGLNNGTLTVATTLRARSGEADGSMKVMERDAVVPATVTNDGLRYFWASAAQTCTITYYDGETMLTEFAVADYTYSEGSSKILPGRSVMTKSGKTFAGWCEDSACRGKETLSLGADDAGNKVLYAYWVDIIPVNLNIGEFTTGMQDSTLLADLTNTVSYSQKGYKEGSLTFTPTVGYELPAALYISSKKLRGSFADPGTYTIRITVTAPLVSMDERQQTIDLEYTVVVTGEHKDKPDVFVENGELTAVKLNGYTEVVIPDGVTNIDHLAFYMFMNALKVVTIPHSLTAIENNAFSSAYGLETIHVAHGDTARIRGLLADAGFTRTVQFIEDPAVTFAMNDGTGDTTIRLVPYGEAVGTLPTPVRAHATFNGWFTTADGGTAVTGEEIVTDDVTYYAHWTIDRVHVKFKKNDGSSATVDERYVDFGSAVGELPTATRDGYRLVGWFTEDGVQISASTLVEESVSVYYYAHWEEKTGEDDWPENTSSVEGQTASVAFGVTGDLAGVDAKSLADWAKGVGNVDYANIGTIVADAYLLNIANNSTAEQIATATAAAREAIKITAITFDEEGKPVLTRPATYGNGRVVLKGATVLSADEKDWDDADTSRDKFFKTVLELKPVE